MDRITREKELRKVEEHFPEVFEAYQVANVLFMNEGGLRFIPNDFHEVYPNVRCEHDKVFIDFSPSFLLSVDKSRPDRELVYFSVSALPGEDFKLRDECSLSELKHLLPNAILLNREYEKKIEEEEE